MSHPNPTYDPEDFDGLSDEKQEELAARAELMHDIEVDRLADAECPDCEGTGVITTPAYQSGGEIVDERTHPCACRV